MSRCHLGCILLKMAAIRVSLRTDWDSTPEGTERCQCHRKTGQMPYFDGPTSAAQCAHLICHTSADHHYDWDRCMWDGEVVATAESDPGEHFTRVTSDPAVLCAGIDPDPLGKCKGSWDQPDRDGCKIVTLSLDLSRCPSR